MPVDSTKQCSACNRPFACGAACGRCWCFDLPAVVAVPTDTDAGCLCPDCLAKLVQTTTANQSNGIAFIRSSGSHA